MNDIILSTQNGEPVASSRQIAESFGKEHKHVLRDIENLIGGESKIGLSSMFFKSEYISAQNKKLPEYLMNRDGFSLLVMGFTGKAALEWKLKYIAAFNEMEKKLAQRPQLSRAELMAQALIAAHDELEHKDRQIAELTPKGIFADAVSASKKSILVGELAKLLCQNGVQIGQNRLFVWMRERGYLIKDPKRSDYNMPTQRAVEQGLFEIKETTVVHSDGHTSINKTPKVTEADVDVLEEKDVAKLLEALQDAPTQFSVITQLALFTGARRGEICSLRWSDINFTTGVISIGRTVQYITGQGLVFTAPKTKRSKRCIRVGAACIALLREYRLTQKAERLKVGSAWARTVQIEGGKVVPNDLLFTKWNGTPLDPNRVTSWFPHFLAAHDLPAVHFHSLRHSNASLLIAAHVPITAVSGRLGHAQTSTTLNIYASMIQSADAAAADALEGVFDRIQEKNHA